MAHKVLVSTYSHISIISTLMLECGHCSTAGLKRMRQKSKIFSQADNYIDKDFQEKNLKWND